MIRADLLADGIHPGDEGHTRIAATVARALTAALKSATENPQAEVPEPRSHILRPTRPFPARVGMTTFGPRTSGDAAPSPVR
jgi:hypothetical protein